MRPSGSGALGSWGPSLALLTEETPRPSRGLLRVTLSDYLHIKWPLWGGEVRRGGGLWNQRSGFLKGKGCRDKERLCLTPPDLTTRGHKRLQETRSLEKSSLGKQKTKPPALLPCGNSLAVQWLGLCILTTKGPGLTPGWGTKIPQASRHGQQNQRSKNEIKNRSPPSHSALAQMRLAEG